MKTPGKLLQSPVWPKDRTVRGSQRSHSSPGFMQAKPERDKKGWDPHPHPPEQPQATSLLARGLLDESKQSWLIEVGGGGSLKCVAAAGV